ncbi:hypothetical protein MAM1_0533c10862 [Mucor ambiguus]|uniref:Uncharacterized protein n=1 Tax=Mucor ambiguus TaxID=91626 RepID=A0A0C9N9A9_9FUNG|nr:hypothetical protein MAM1_0533c10862 [Mucor ambiguus]
MACNTLSRSPRIQDNCVLAAKNGNLRPIFFTSSNVNKAVTEGAPISTNADDLFKHTIGTSPTYGHIADQALGKGWTIFPQLRFATSQIFAGNILLSGSTALLVNSVESYGRLKTVDSHHERRTGSFTLQYSFPKTESKYGQLVVCLTQDDNTTNLKSGAVSCNLLVTSNTRLDKQTMTNKTIKVPCVATSTTTIRLDW